jgi:F0F1-type ATP synthase assembly protein I
MKQTKARTDVPSPLANSQPEGLGSKSPNNIFVSLALDMSWRLAIVVLIPVIGGFKLDGKFHTSPLLTLVGFLVAICGMALVLWRTLLKANQIAMPKKEDK